ncbi:MAG: hypothetical protein ACTHNU_14155 [Gaiellales bacterium]
MDTGLYAPTLYKARRVPVKSPVCAICVDRTRGRCRKVELRFGVAVWLCAAHASVEFQRQRSGRDFVLTLQRLWESHGCLTPQRRRALTAHLVACSGTTKPLPGSYAWPALRRTAEAWFADGVSVPEASRRLTRELGGCPARPPTPRTLSRWRAERRWLGPNVPCQPPAIAASTPASRPRASRDP